MLYEVITTILLLLNHQHYRIVLPLPLKFVHQMMSWKSWVRITSYNVCYTKLLRRILQGAAIGGEVPGAWVFVSEHVPGRRIGYACGTLTAGLTAGILLGSLVATALNTFVSQENIIAWGWRIPFLLGGVFGFVAMMLRRWLEETPIFAEMKAKKQLVEGLPLKQA